MQVSHHPPVELLTAFSASSLQLSHSLCVATHLELCPVCRSNVHQLSCLGGSMLTELEPSSVPSGLKDSVMSRLLDEPAPIQRPKIDVNCNVPRALQQFIPNGYDDLDWSRKTPSVRAVDLCKDGNGAHVSLLRISAGGKVGHHSHIGEELTLVLDGSFSDESGIFQRGDLALRDGHEKHQPIASKDSDCICLAVQDGPIQFTGFFARLLNPLLRRSY